MQGVLVRRRTGLAAAATMVAFLASPAGLAQSSVENDPMLGPLLDTLMEDQAPGSGTGTVEIDETDAVEIAEITGFRSARFGMTEEEVLEAIAADLGIDAADVERETNQLERTESLVVTADDLIPDSGTAAVAYIFGYQSGTLIQVNVIWGAPVDEDYRADTLMLTGQALQQFFAGRRYAEGSVFADVLLSDGTLVMFTGSDEEGRQATLALVTRVVDIAVDAEAETAGEADTAADGQGAGDRQLLPLALRLSYVADPDDPDIFRIAPGTF